MSKTKKPGRKPTNPRGAFNARTMVRMFKAELISWTAAAKRDGCSLSNWIRRMASNHVQARKVVAK